MRDLLNWIAERVLAVLSRAMIAPRVALLAQKKRLK
jgi:hypothetical protein